MVAVWPERLHGIDFFENSSESETDKCPKSADPVGVTRRLRSLLGLPPPPFVLPLEPQKSHFARTPPRGESDSHPSNPFLRGARPFCNRQGQRKQAIKSKRQIETTRTYQVKPKMSSALYYTFEKLSEILAPGPIS